MGSDTGPGGQPSDTADDPSSEVDTSGAFPVPVACSNVGLEYTLGCDDCPLEERVCDCPAELVFPYFAPCYFGRCLQPFDCEALCSRTTGTFEENNEYLAQLFSCAITYLCTVDEHCGDGFCVQESAGELGGCGTGQLSEGCIDAGDCSSGICALRADGQRWCNSGDLESVCNTNEQCGEGACVIFDEVVDPTTGEPTPTGMCSLGMDDEFCRTDADCAEEFHCVGGSDEGAAAARAAGVLGYCYDGTLDDPCTDRDECLSGICFQSRCVSGDFLSPCASGDECLSGYCSIQPVETARTGTCVPGDLGSPCYTDAVCDSGICALDRDSTEGLCFAGEPGDPCHDDADCLSGSCLDPLWTERTSPCEPGDACGGDGICVYTGCEHGKCE